MKETNEMHLYGQRVKDSWEVPEFLVAIEALKSLRQNSLCGAKALALPPQIHTLLSVPPGSLFVCRPSFHAQHQHVTGGPISYIDYFDHVWAAAYRFTRF
jgi:hypothetical protein